MSEERNYRTMAGKSIGKCASGHWLPLKGNCDLCGASPDDKCRYQRAALDAAREIINRIVIPPADEAGRTS